MIKILAFLEAELPRVEQEINKYANTHEILYVYHTGSRLIFILKEKKRSHHAQKES